MSSQQILFELYHSLSQSGQDGAIPIVREFLERRIKLLELQYSITEQEERAREFAKVTEQMAEQDALYVTHAVVQALKPLVQIKRVPRATIGSIAIFQADL